MQDTCKLDEFVVITLREKSLLIEVTQICLKISEISNYTARIMTINKNKINSDNSDLINI